MVVPCVCRLVVPKSALPGDVLSVLAASVLAVRGFTIPLAISLRMMVHLTMGRD